MANKLFGGKGSGRFSGEKDPADATDLAPDDLGQNDLAMFELELKQELQQELQQDLPIDLDDPLGDPLEGLDLPEQMVTTTPRKSAPGRTAPAQERSNARKPAQAREPEQTKAASKTKQSKPKQKKPALRIVAILLGLLLFIESAYCVVIFTDWIKPLAALRNIYIDTAMITMRHQWLATALIPGDIVQDVVDRREASRSAQMGVDSKWEDVDKDPTPTKSPSSGFSKEAAASILSGLAQDVGFSNEEDKFFELFYELDEKSTRAYAESHPEAIANGWDKFWVNEAGLDDEGTDIYTTQGDQVLAIDAANGLMVIRVTGSTYRGVLVIGKDASRLKCAPSSKWGTAGEWVGDIAQNNNGLVAMTGSGFGDDPSVEEGADQAGGAMCSGETFGYHYPWGYKRVELHKDNRLYIVDAQNDYSENCTDATEWTPALIVDGVNVAGEDYTYTALNPRTCIGQTKDESILMLGIEGRKVDSLGCNAEECAAILERYGAYQAMNVDGGTSSIMWYEGEYIMRCSNSNLIPEGRQLPNAWVYCASPVPN